MNCLSYLSFTPLRTSKAHLDGSLVPDEASLIRYTTAHPLNHFYSRLANVSPIICCHERLIVASTFCDTYVDATLRCQITDPHCFEVVMKG